MAGFESQLESINAVADRSPGFVWRLAGEAGDATAIRAFPDAKILVNMSVWESLEALHQYVYRSPHLAPLRDRREWFEPMEGPHLVLWWITAGSIPTVDEGRPSSRSSRGEDRRKTPSRSGTPFPPRVRRPAQHPRWRRSFVTARPEGRP